MPDTSLLTFQECISRTNQGKRHLLLGNGFSIACRSDMFSYATLLSRARFRKNQKKIRKIFKILGTSDFEEAINLLQRAARVVDVYSDDQDKLAKRLKRDAKYLRKELARTIAASHDPARHDRLQIELQQFDPLPSNVKIEPHLGEFQDVIEGVSDSLESSNRKLAPTLAFIDPFGVSGVPMKLIARFLDSRKCELFLILMVDHLNRFLSAEHMKGGRDSLFGTNDFLEVEAAPAGERIPMLVDLYQRQMRDVAKFEYTQGFEMKRANKTVAYYVVYATRSITGVEKFKDAMWKVDPSTGTSFSDRNWNQGSLLTGSNVELSELQQRLSEQFGGESVSIKRLDEFTLLDTPYRKPHLRKALQAMKGQGRIQITKPTNSRKEFPEGTRIHFQAGLGI